MLRHLEDVPGHVSLAPGRAASALVRVARTAMRTAHLAAFCIYIMFTMLTHVVSPLSLPTFPAR